jgi:hypothetical protein
MRRAKSEGLHYRNYGLLGVVSICLASATGGFIGNWTSGEVASAAQVPAKTGQGSLTLNSVGPLKPPTLSEPQLAPVDVSPPAATYTAINAALSTQASSVYGGMNLNAAGAQVIHVLAGGQSQVQSIVAQTLASLPASEAMSSASLTYTTATESLATLMSQESILTQNVSQLKAEGVGLDSWGPDIVNNKLEVDIYGLTAANESLIESVLSSPSDIEFISDSSPTRPLSRKTDSSPWWGGDLLTPIEGNSEEECTSGFPVENSSGLILNVTAGHCTTGVGSSHVIKQNGQSYGYTYQRYYCNDCNGDAQTVTTYPNTAQGYIYTKGVDDTTSKEVTATASSEEVGAAVCFDGYAFQAYLAALDEDPGAPCAKITAMNQCLSGVGPYTICAQWISDAGSGNYITATGDSGGPVFQNNSTGVTAMGIMTDAANCLEGLYAIVCSKVWFTTQDGVDYAFGVNAIEG